MGAALYWLYDAEWAKIERLLFDRLIRRSRECRKRGDTVEEVLV
jgi:hypothetical protein